MRLKIILDTNIFISAFFYGGNCRKILDRAGIFELYFSQILIEEVLRKMVGKFNASPEQIEAFRFIVQNSELLKPQGKIKICRDPNDNFLLELAEASQADFLITGDQDLLSLRHWKRTKIIKPAEFMEA